MSIPYKLCANAISAPADLEELHPDEAEGQEVKPEIPVEEGFRYDSSIPDEAEGQEMKPEGRRDGFPREAVWGGRGNRRSRFSIPQGGCIPSGDGVGSGRISIYFRCRI